MKGFTFFAILCLSAIAYVSALDLLAGTREDDDYLVAEKRLYKPAMNGVSQVARTYISSVGRIVYIEGINSEKTDSSVNVVAGGVGHHYAVVVALGNAGQPIDVTVRAYAVFAVRDSAEVEPEEPLA